MHWLVKVSSDFLISLTYLLFIDRFKPSGDDELLWSESFRDKKGDLEPSGDNCLKC